jgi:predicted alpha/beta superfamily hydrolase
MKRSWIWTAAGTLVLMAAASLATIAVLTQDGPPPGTSRGTLASTVLGESRDYVVHLPRSYTRLPQRRYAVAYVLDAGPQFTAMVSSNEILARLGLVPELIVVGIPSPDDAARQRDYTPPGMRQDVDLDDSPMGEADRFLAFLGDELIPEVDRRYRTNATRILSGHSRGGLFVVHSLVARPDLFRARFAHSPALWREAHRMVERIERQRTSLASGGFLYLSIGDAETEKMRAGFDHGLRALADAPPSLRWCGDVSVGADHGSNAGAATPVALYRFFAAAATPEASCRGAAPGG